MKVPMDGLLMPNWLPLAGRWQPQTWMRRPPGPMPSSPLSLPKNDETRWLAWTLRRCVYSSKSLSSVRLRKMSLIDEMYRSVRSAWWTWREVSGLTPRGRRELGLRWQIYLWLLFLCMLHFVSEANCLLIVWQEGANINKSLTTLGKVISALAEMVGSLIFLRMSGNDFASFCLSKCCPLLPSTAEQQEEEKWLHPLPRLCSHVAAKRKPGWETHRDYRKNITILERQSEVALINDLTEVLATNTKLSRCSNDSCKKTPHC